MQNSELQAIVDNIAQLRAQLPDADDGTMKEILDELSALRAAATSILDAWMEVDDAIEELLAEILAVSQSPLATTFGGTSEYEQETPSEQMDSHPPSQAYEQPSSSGRMNGLLSGPISLTETWFDLSLKAQCFLRRGLAYFDLCMYQEAANILTQSVARQDNPRVRLYIALSHLAAGRADLAAIELSMAKQSASDRLTMQAVLEVEAHVHEAYRDWHAAVHVLYELLTYGGDHASVWYNLGICHLHLSEYAAAERCFDRASAQDREDSDAVLWRTLALCLTGRNHDAKAVLNASVPPNASREAFAMMSVLTHLGAGMVQSAIEEARAFRVTHPYHSLGDELMGLCLIAAGHPEAAFLHYKRAICLAPRQTNAVAMFGVCSYFLDNIPRAQQAFQWVEAERPLCELEQLIQGRIDAIQRSYDAALERFSILSEHRRPHIRRLAVLYRGMLYTNIGDATLAACDFQRALQLGIAQEAIDAARAQADLEALQTI